MPAVVWAGGCCSKQAVAEAQAAQQEYLSRLVVQDESTIPTGRPAFDGGFRDLDASTSHANSILESTASSVAIFTGDEVAAVSQNTPEFSSTEKSRCFLPVSPIQAIVGDLVAHKKGESLNCCEGYDSDNEDDVQDDAIEWRGYCNRKSQFVYPQVLSPKEADFTRPHFAHSDSKEFLREVLVRTNLSGLRKRQGAKFNKKKVYAVFRKNKKAEPLVPQDEVRWNLWSEILASFIPSYIDNQGDEHDLLQPY